MSKATNLIAKYWIREGIEDFFISASELEQADIPLIESGVLTLSKTEQKSILCPFGCGELEPIHILKKADGSIDRLVICSAGNGEIKLEPKDYQLYEFDPLAMLRFSGGVSKQPNRGVRRKFARSKNTSWILVERNAVLEFANDPKRNKLQKEPHELCHHVWNINREEFEMAAQLPPKKRGYKNADALRAYFYRLRRKYSLSKHPN